MTEIVLRQTVVLEPLMKLDDGCFRDGQALAERLRLLESSGQVEGNEIIEVE